MSILDQLFDAVYYGADLEFKYGVNYFFISSGTVNDNNVEKHSISVIMTQKSFYGSQSIGKCMEIYSSTEVNSNENTHNFFEAKIFKGNSLYEIIDFITDINY